MTIKTPVQLRWNDMDMLGHLYNGTYHNIFDLGLSEFHITSLGVSYTTDSNLWLLKVSSTINYIDQITINDVIEVHTSLQKIGSKSVTFYQELINTESGSVVSNCTSVAVAYDPKARCSVLVPDFIKTIFNKG